MYALRTAVRRSPCLLRAPTGARLRIHAVRSYAVVADAALPKRTKVWDSIDEAVKDVKSGDILLSGGMSRPLRSAREVG